MLRDVTHRLEIENAGAIRAGVFIHEEDIFLLVGSRRKQRRSFVTYFVTYRESTDSKISILKEGSRPCAYQPVFCVLLSRTKTNCEEFLETLHTQLNETPHFCGTVPVRCIAYSDRKGIPDTDIELSATLDWIKTRCPAYIAAWADVPVFTTPTAQFLLELYASIQEQALAPASLVLSNDAWEAFRSVGGSAEADRVRHLQVLQPSRAMLMRGPRAKSIQLIIEALQKVRKNKKSKQLNGSHP